MMTPLSKDEFIACLHYIDSAAYTQAYIDKAVAHDQAQRVVVEQQAKELEQWKAAAQMHNGVYEPLQHENKALREALQALLEHIDRIAYRDSAQLRLGPSVPVIEQAQHAHNNEKASAELGKETQVLREALQLLYDTQNGCPLPKYESDWNRAMELAARVLKEVS